MKVLMVNKFLFPNGGSETYIFNLGEELIKQGHEVEYFGMDHSERIVGNHAESYTLSMDFHTGKLQKLLYPFKIIYSLEARRKIRAVLDDFKPDIVHLNNFNFQITPSIIYEIRKWGKRHGQYIPIVYTAHDYQWVCPNHMMYIPNKNELCFRCEGGKFEECIKQKCIHNSTLRSLLGTIEAELYKALRTYEKVDMIICPSKYMGDKLGTNKALRDKIRVLYNFQDSTEDGNENMVKTCTKRDYVIYFGRYTKEKGVLSLMNVCKQLADIPFVFAGNGEYARELEKCKNIKNVGFKRGQELEKLVREARFSVFPSEWYENCPFSVMESQLYGTPVVASDIGGVPELVENGVTGELFEPGNEKELKDKIQSLWNNNNKLQAYTDNCRNKKFISLNEYAECLIGMYRDLKRKVVSK